MHGGTGEGMVQDIDALVMIIFLPPTSSRTETTSPQR